MSVEDVMNRAQILDEAKRLTTGDREATHGAPEENFRKLALVWTGILGHPVRHTDVPLMLAGLKIVRATSGARNADDFVDIAGYAALAGEIALKE